MSYQYVKGLFIIGTSLGSFYNLYISNLRRILTNKIKKNGAPGGSRTLTLLAQGFEACVSTNSTTRATCNQYTNCREVATRPIHIRLWVPAGAPYLTVGSPEDVRSQVLTGASCGLYRYPEGSRTPVTRSKFLRITVMLRGN